MQVKGVVVKEQNVMGQRLVAVIVTKCVRHVILDVNVKVIVDNNGTCPRCEQRESDDESDDEEQTPEVLPLVPLVPPEVLPHLYHRKSYHL